MSNGSNSGSSKCSSAETEIDGISNDDISVFTVSTAIDTRYYHTLLAQETNADGTQALQNMLSKGLSTHDKIPSDISVEVLSLTYSEKTKLIYATSGKQVGSFNWDGKRVILKDRLRQNSEVIFQCLALGPIDQQKPSEDSLYLSVGYGANVNKKILLLTGSKLQNEALVETEEVKEKCDLWKIASNLSRDLLIVHPQSTDSFYVYVCGVLKKKIKLDATICQGISQIQINGDKLILASDWAQNVSVYEMIVSPTECSIKTSNAFGPVLAHDGCFGALKLDSNVNDIFIITKTGGTEASAFKYRNGNKNASCKIDLKTYMAPMHAVASQDHAGNSCVLLIGRNNYKHLCAVELKRKRKENEKTGGGNPQPDCKVL